MVEGAEETQPHEAALAFALASGSSGVSGRLPLVRAPVERALWDGVGELELAVHTGPRKPRPRRCAFFACRDSG